MNRPRMLYRLRTQTVAVPLGETRPVALFIPSGSLLRVPVGDTQDSSMVEVEWDGKRVQIFAVDLQERGELVQAAGE